MIQQNDLIKIGNIRKTFGKRGELLLETTNDLLESAQTDFVWLSIDSLFVPFFISDWRYKTDSAVILQVEDINTEQEALPLVGTDVFIERTAIPDDTPIMSDFTSLIGYKVYDYKDGFIGEITHIDDSTANLIIGLSTDILLPLHDDLIEKIDETERSLYLNLPDGLLNLN